MGTDYDHWFNAVNALNRLQFDSPAAVEKAMESSVRGKFREAEAKAAY